MQSWSLRKFVDERSILEASLVWHKSQTAVYTALSSKRNIRVTLLKGMYTIWENKELGYMSEKRLKGALRAESKKEKDNV